MIYVAIVSIGWVAFILYWAVSAAFAKRAARGPRWLAAASIRLLGAFLMVAIIHALRKRRLFLHHGGAVVAYSPAIHILGVIVFVAGVCFAIWARLYLGTNWGMPMTLRVDHQLVTSGPYQFVRHPIYFGFLLAVAGSVLAGLFWWAAAFPVMFVYFLYSAYNEENLMMQQFPAEYPDYKKRTKMLIPLVF